VDIERFTLKAQDAIDRSCRLAVKNNHKHVTPAHLLLGLLEQADGPTKKYLAQGGVDSAKLVSSLNKAIASVPKHAGDSGDTPINRDYEALLHKADDVSGELEDKYIGINHLLLAACGQEKLAGAMTE